MLIAQFFTSFLALANAECIETLRLSSTSTHHVKVNTDQFDVCFSEALQGFEYEFRLYTPGFSKFSYSPEKARVTDKVKKVSITRIPKTSFVSETAVDDVVFTLDPYVEDLFPSTLMPVVQLGTVIVSISVLAALGSRKFLPLRSLM